MRLHRFYISNPISSDELDITDKAVLHQWRSVFRYNTGSQVILFDGSGTDHLCLITHLKNNAARVTVLQKKDIHRMRKRNVWLCLSLVKKDKFEFMVEKATELGVTRIIPLLSERSEKKKINTERLKKIIIEAAEQSGRADLLEVSELTSLEELFESGILPQDKIAFDAKSIPLKQYLTESNLPSVAAFIGPEGGFSEKELELFTAHNIPILSLGTQTLRAETAAIAVSSLLLL